MSGRGLGKRPAPPEGARGREETAAPGAGAEVVRDAEMPARDAEMPARDAEMPARDAETAARGTGTAPARAQTLLPPARPRRARLISAALRLLVRAAALLTAGVLLFLVGYILVMGVPNLRASLFAWEYTSDNVSLVPAALNTVLTIVLTLLICLPLGIGAAIYLVEYTGRGNRFVGLVRLTAETLSGIPSIVYGLFGMLFFVTALHWGRSLIAGACTLAVMILPLIMRTTEEALRAVPDSYREGSFGLGAGRLRTVFRIVLPPAMPGILAGVILAIGRIVGESAALIYTAGTIPELALSLGDSARTLSVHMYVISNEGLHVNEAYATAAVLLAIVGIVNALSAALARRIAGGRKQED